MKWLLFLASILNKFCFWEYCVNKVLSLKKTKTEHKTMKHQKQKEKKKIQCFCLHRQETVNETDCCTVTSMLFVDWYTSPLVVFGFFISRTFYSPSHIWYNKALVATLRQCNTDSSFPIKDYFMIPFLYKAVLDHRKITKARTLTWSAAFFFKYVSVIPFCPNLLLTKLDKGASLAILWRLNALRIKERLS